MPEHPGPAALTLEQPWKSSVKRLFDRRWFAVSTRLQVGGSPARASAFLVMEGPFSVLRRSA